MTGLNSVCNSVYYGNMAVPPNCYHLCIEKSTNEYGVEGNPALVEMSEEPVVLSKCLCIVTTTAKVGVLIDVITV